jgi:uncharacterized protein YbbC (DUF1343 family)
MRLNLHFFVALSILGLLFFASCATPFSLRKDHSRPDPWRTNARFMVGAERTSLYLPLLQGKRVGVVVNLSSRIGQTHLVDSLVSRGVNIVRIFSPEHGFRGLGDAGQVLPDEVDAKTGIPIISLYGSKKKPLPADIKGLDVVVFDLQDVGVRFYTYLSTLHYVLEACGENGVSVMVLDRPNPNGHFVDGPVLEERFRSFVGMHPIPVVHGMTLGELGQMINGECWLADSVSCHLTVIACKGYYRGRTYELPVRPSPNLPNMLSVYLYPSLCFFEGTIVSVGRGTQAPFQMYGAPGFPSGTDSFTPIPMPGASHPPYEGELCSGYDLRYLSPDLVREHGKIDLRYILEFYQHFPNPDNFFLPNKYIDLLAGTDQLRLQIQQGLSEQDIRATWQAGLERFMQLRKPYLLYKSLPK